MIKRRIGWLLALVAVIAAFALAGCSSSPPDNLNQAAQSAKTQIDDARTANDKAKAQFSGLLKQTKYAFMASYTPAQQHADRFDQARTTLDAAQKQYDTTVQSVLDSYDDSKRSQLDNSIKAVSATIAKAKALTADPAQWLAKVAATQADPAGAVRTAATAISDITTVYTPLTGDVDTAKKTYPTNASTIDSKFKPMVNEHDTALQAFGLLQAESKKAPPNYADMTTYAMTVTTNAAAFKKDAAAFQAQLARLSVTETQTLVDIRVDSTIEIDRTTWDDSLDFPDEHDYTYPEVPVDQATASYFAQFKPDQDVLASATTQAFGSGVDFQTESADRSQWDKLHIDPNHPAWVDGDSNGEFYVGAINDTYCDKLHVLVNGKPDTSGRPKPASNYCSKYDNPADIADGTYWVEADELDAGSIGMDIYSKGVGDFDSQADTEAAPPGMVYVGDTTTGHWQTDSNGNSFWVFYGQYRFFSDLIGGPSPWYYRSDYNTWNTQYRYGHGRPYYGTYNGQPRFGLKSPLTQARFPHSTFETSGVAGMSVRGAGPAARGGGPGGGGK